MMRISQILALVGIGVICAARSGAEPACQPETAQAALTGLDRLAAVRFKTSAGRRKFGAARDLEEILPRALDEFSYEVSLDDLTLCMDRRGLVGLLGEPDQSVKPDRISSTGKTEAYFARFEQFNYALDCHRDTDGVEKCWRYELLLFDDRLVSNEIKAAPADGERKDQANGM